MQYSPLYLSEGAVRDGVGLERNIDTGMVHMGALMGGNGVWMGWSLVANCGQIGSLSLML
jgi:hypothetical protein